MNRSAVTYGVPSALAIATAVYLAVFLGASFGPSFGWLLVAAIALGCFAVALGHSLRALARGGSHESARPASVGQRRRRDAQQEKQATLRSIKELEFDHRMGKLSKTDFDQMSDLLRERAIRLIKELDEPVPSSEPHSDRQPATGNVAHLRCRGCKTENDPDADFCKRCGERMTRSCKCGAGNDGDADFCKKCGAKL